MSDLPAIDYFKVSQRLSTRLGAAELQLANMEMLAEALRDERDEARKQANTLTQENTILLRQIDDTTN